MWPSALRAGDQWLMMIWRWYDDDMMTIWWWYDDDDMMMIIWGWYDEDFMMIWLWNDHMMWYGEACDHQPWKQVTNESNQYEWKRFAMIDDVFGISEDSCQKRFAIIYDFYGGIRGCFKEDYVMFQCCNLAISSESMWPTI